jgi:flavin-dependent dehydrogenase
MEEDVLHKNPLLRQIFTNAEFLYSKPLTISQISFSNKNQVQDGILLLGDAAGMITPLCGNGMSMAMHGSKLAMMSINNFLLFKISRADMEREYVIQWRNMFSKRLWFGRRVQQLFGGEYTTAMFFKIMEALPPLAKGVIRSTHGAPF